MRASERAGIASRRCGSTTRVPAPRVDVPYAARTYVRSNTINTHLNAFAARRVVRADRDRTQLRPRVRATFRAGEADGCVTRCDSRVHVYTREYSCARTARRDRERKHLARNVTHSLESGGHFATHGPCEGNILTSARKPKRSKLEITRL